MRATVLCGMERKSRVVTGAPAAGEGISHLFGIYRSRTPDVKNRLRIRFMFVPVILGALLLVIFLIIIDVTKSPSNGKVLPVARLSRLYSYGSALSGRHNYTEENIINVNKINIDNLSNSRSRNNAFGYKRYETQTSNRTRLHQIPNSVDKLEPELTGKENTSNANKNIRNSELSLYSFTFGNTQESVIVNDGDKIDRSGRIDSISRRLSGDESATRLQNNKRATLRTGRIMNNPISPYVDNKFSIIPNAGLSPPFTATPMYGSTFAQLGPYKSVKSIKSIGDILKYVVKQNPSNIYITTTFIPETVEVRKGVKFTGTYKMPLEGSESGSSFVGRTNNKDFKGFRSFYSQTYVPFYDPFKNFKPINPLEINKLISTDTKSEAISNLINKAYFAEPSSAFNFVSTTPRSFSKEYNEYNNQSRYHTSGSHTIAVFKPLEPARNYGLRFTKQTSPEISNRKTKPFSVTLDIYPMTVGKEQVSSGNSQKASFQLASQKKNKPFHPRWKHRPDGPLRGPRFRIPSDVHSDDNERPENHMIVHLNVFPDRTKKQPRQGRGRGTNKSVLNTVIAGGTFGHRSFDSGSLVEDYNDYDDINSSLESNDTSLTEANELYITTERINVSADVEHEKKVSYDFLRAEGGAEDSINTEREIGNSYVSDDEDQMEKYSTSISDTEITRGKII